MRALILFVLTLGSIAAALYWWEQGRPIPMTDAADDTVQCMSYAPYRRGVTPLDKKTIISPSQIEADLAILSRRTDCVRIYSVDQGLSEVPRIARKFGMKTIVGIWIGRDLKQNEREMALGIETVQRYRDVVRAVIVGNEVLLRHEQPVAALRAYIDRVVAETGLPVSYADVWEYWLRNPEVAQSTSFVTIHILPYWEDIPAPIDHAIQHVLWVYHTVQTAFPGEDILIGETGWPSRGRNRFGAQPSLVNEARFVREFSLTALKEGLKYNIIEAFDQPWKRQLEGTVGGYWGLYNADGKVKFSFFGPIAENANWMRGLACGGIGLFAFSVLGFIRRPRSKGWGRATMALGGFCFGATAAAQWEAFAYTPSNMLQTIVIGLYSLCALWASLRLVQALARSVSGSAIPRPAPIGAFVHWFNSNSAEYRSIERSLGLMRMVLLFGVATLCLLHVADPRYRDFPLALYGLPVCGYALLALASWLNGAFDRDHRAHSHIEERVLATWLVPAAISISLREGWANPYAQLWAGLCLLFALTIWLPQLHTRRRRAREGQRAEQ